MLNFLAWSETGFGYESKCFGASSPNRMNGNTPWNIMEHHFHQVRTLSRIPSGKWLLMKENERNPQVGIQFKTFWPLFNCHSGIKDWDYWEGFTFVRGHFIDALLLQFSRKSLLVQLGILGPLTRPSIKSPFIAFGTPNTPLQMGPYCYKEYPNINIQ